MKNDFTCLRLSHNNSIVSSIISLFITNEDVASIFLLFVMLVVEEVICSAS